MQAHGGIHAKGTLGRWLAALLLLALVNTPVGGMAARSETELEFDFARGLIELNLPDMAERVMDRLVMRHPGLAERANVIRAEAMIHRRRLDAAEEILRNMPADSPSAQAILLALADAYFQVGERQKTREIYMGFFERFDGQPPTDPDVVRFLRESAHKYAQMLVIDRDFRGAVEVYDLLISVIEKGAGRRQILLEQAEVALQAADDIALDDAEREQLFEKAEENFTEVLWGGRDLWFGRALTAYAQFKVIRGDRHAAREMLRSNIRLMRDMDQQLAEMDIPMSESPMAGARSLLGSLFMTEGELMMAPAARRQTEALTGFENALNDFSAEWAVMVRAKRREDAARSRTERDTEDTDGTIAAQERMRPYEDMRDSLERFIDMLAAVSWEPEVVERGRSTETNVRELFNNVREFNFAPGISPNLGIAINENFSGNQELRQAGTFLRSEDERRKDAVDYYLRALTEYYNVFANYAGSHWSSSAGEIVGRLRNALFDLTGKNVIIEVGAGQEEKMAMVYIKEGHSLFGREQYEEALEQYLLGVNTAGETTDALIAMSNMMEAYARRSEHYAVRMLAHYLAERFAERTEAAQAILRIGRHYYDAGNNELFHYIYELFLSGFPEHERAPAVLFMLGEQQWRVKNYAAAATYYRRITEKYPRSTQYLDALNRIGWGYFLDEDYTNAVHAFTDYINEVRPSRDRAQAQLCLAESYRKSDQPIQALRAYSELIQWLAPEDNPYADNAEQRRQNKELLQQAEFFIGFALSHLNEPPERIPAYRQRAIEQFRAFVDKYPESGLAPTAMASMGAIHFERDRPEEAAAKFEKLTERYPESEAGQNARFAMIRSLIDIRQLDRAKNVFEEMMDDAGRYSAGQFVRVGQLMLDHGEYANAERAFLQVTGATEERNLLERSLFGLGRSQIELGKYADAARHLQELIRRYPRSGRFFDARFLLGRALAEQGDFAEAADALHDVFRRASDAELINRASLELAKIQLLRGAEADAMASFQRIVLLADPGNPAVRPYYEQAVLGSIRLFMQQEEWEEVIEHCDLYMNHFTLGKHAAEVREFRSRAMRRRAEG